MCVGVVAQITTATCSTIRRPYCRASSGFTSRGKAFDNTGGSITTTDSAITIDHSGAVKVGGALSAGTGNVDIDSTVISFNLLLSSIALTARLSQV